MYRVCGNPMKSPGHTQYSGQRYCPYTPGQEITGEEWLKQKREERLKKKQEEAAHKKVASSS